MSIRVDSVTYIAECDCPGCAACLIQPADPRLIAGLRCQGACGIADTLEVDRLTCRRYAFFAIDASIASDDPRGWLIDNKLVEESLWVGDVLSTSTALASGQAACPPCAAQRGLVCPSLVCPNCGASASLPLGMTCDDHQPQLVPSGDAGMGMTGGVEDGSAYQRLRHEFEYAIYNAWTFGYSYAARPDDPAVSQRETIRSLTDNVMQSAIVKELT